jgi:uncharacterized membrane protein
MDKMIVAVFDSEKEASEGLRALQGMHAEGTIVLYSTGVIAKDQSGKVTVKKDVEQGPAGAALGLATGSLLGLLGGPVGLAIGAATGTMAGFLADLANAGVDVDFVEEVGRSLQPGKVAVVAEVEEQWVIPVDSRMEDLGGEVYRRSRFSVIDAQIERGVDALDADIQQMETELKSATVQVKAKLQAKLDAAKQRLESMKNQAKSRLESLKTEADAKIKLLKEQATKAQADRKAKLDKRAAEIKADFDARFSKLSQAWQRTKEALKV